MKLETKNGFGAWVSISSISSLHNLKIHEAGSHKPMKLTALRTTAILLHVLHCMFQWVRAENPDRLVKGSDMHMIPGWQIKSTWSL